VVEEVIPEAAKRRNKIARGKRRSAPPLDHVRKKIRALKGRNKTQSSQRADFSPAKAGD
jgi:hypothetical protein